MVTLSIIMGMYTLLVTTVCLLQISGNHAFKVANTFGDGMVLQRAPIKSVIWGTADTKRYGGKTVTITVSKGQKNAVAVGSGFVEVNNNGPVSNWKVVMPATPAGGPYVITAFLDGVQEEDAIVLNDVLFGDVWICSGQSNMDMQLFKVLNGTEEISNGPKFTDIRIYAVDTYESSTPLPDVVDIKQAWTRPSIETLRQYSALCWKFGRKMHQHTKIPIGLMQATWGGTRVEAWSSPDALTECYGDSSVFNPNDPSVLWNGMIHPLLKTSITGTIWYQGERNARLIRETAGYECTFPAMIRDWRRKFLANNEQTAPEFPFGFVQIAGKGRDYNTIGSFPLLRWKQTAERGSVPNDLQVNTFMAVAHDLPDFQSPYGSIHPRDKETVAERLFLGARAIHLGEKDVLHAGPIPIAYRFNTTSNVLELQYTKGLAIQVRQQRGFEICCSDSVGSPCTNEDSRWIPANIMKFNKEFITLSVKNCQAKNIIGHRYAWRENPCPYKSCAVYAARSDIPAPVYVSLVHLKDDSVWHNIEF